MNIAIYFIRTRSNLVLSLVWEISFIYVLMPISTNIDFNLSLTYSVVSFFRFKN